MPAENERDELARLLRDALWHNATSGLPASESEFAADAILSSPWLAGQLKQARVDALEEAAAATQTVLADGTAVGDWTFNDGINRAAAAIRELTTKETA